MAAHRARVQILLSLVIALSFGATQLPRADEPDEDASPEGTSLNLNLRGLTLGGKQFWTDELVHHAWRIQRNVMSGHYRLLDPTNARRAWGSWEQCHAQWVLLREQEQVPPLKPKVVLVLHGLGRTRSSMARLAGYLETHGDYDVLNISYASTREALGEDAASLAQVISRLEGVEEINFVAHSMGNLVIRHLLHRQLVDSRGLSIDPRIHRFVMLAPPNNGAALAERFRYDPAFRILFGTGGQQFTRDWHELQEQLPVPTCPFGIIAGRAGDGPGGNPMLEGDDDMIVRVEETRLPGAADFVVVPAVHAFIMNDALVQEYTLRFLQHGYFISPEKRQPIERATPGKDDVP